MSDFVLNNIKDGIRTITLNRPDKLNAVNIDLVVSTLDAFREANADVDTRVVIFRGAGRAFCAGYDLDSHTEGRSAQDVRIGIDRIQAITREIVLGNKVVIGAIHGWAVGAGFEWAIDCDLALWGETARGFFPELEWGLFLTGGATAIAPRQIGLANFKELGLLREKQSAARLHELGLVWRVVADNELFAEAEAVAARIAELPTNALIDFKRIANRACYLDVEDAMALETEATDPWDIGSGLSSIDQTVQSMSKY